MLTVVLLHLNSWVWQRKNSEPGTLIQEVYLESHRGRSESVGLCGLRKQITEAKEGPLDLRRKKAKVCTWERCVCVCVCVRERERDRERERERERLRASSCTGSLALGVFICFLKAEILGEILKYSSAFQVCPFRVVISWHVWPKLREGVISHFIWFWCWTWHCFKWFCSFSEPEAETQLGLDIISSLKNCLCGQQNWGFIPKII